MALNQGVELPRFPAGVPRRPAVSIRTISRSSANGTGIPGGGVTGFRGSRRGTSGVEITVVVVVARFAVARFLLFRRWLFARSVTAGGVGVAVPACSSSPQG